MITKNSGKKANPDSYRDQAPKLKLYNLRFVIWNFQNDLITYNYSVDRILVLKKN